MNHNIIICFICSFFAFPSIYAQESIDTLTFEDFTLDSTGYYNGSSLGTTGALLTYTHDYCTFENSFTDWGGGSSSWYGFAVSQVQDSVTPGHFNQYAAFPYGGSNGSAKYGISYLVPEDYNVPAAVYGGQKIVFDTVRTLRSIDITNTTYSIKSMRHGDQFAKVFGSPYASNNGQHNILDGTDGKDWFVLKIVPLDANDSIVGDTINFYLADYRFDDTTQNYMVEDWRTISFGGIQAKKLEFFITSSDVGAYGLNTPAYFAFDNLISYICTPSNENIDSTIAYDQLPFVWGGQTISTSGTWNLVDTLSNVNGCDSIVSLNLTVQDPPAVSSIADEINANLYFYPNPTSDQLTMDIDQKASIQFVSIQGEVVKNQEIEGKTTIDVSRLAKGFYLLRVKTRDGEQQHKIQIH